MITNTPQTLSTAPFTHPTLDYAWLRATAIRQLERLTGGQWTDFNAHDPGITILEQFCYALTDLSYRIDYDLKDLLTGDATEPYSDLFSPATILTSNPVTLTDLRKVVLDVAGVRNAWIAPQETVTPPLYYDPADQSLYLQEGPQRQPLALRGVYQVLVAADRPVDGVAVDEVTLRNAVSQRLHACRNLGETFDPPRILPQQRITVRAELEVAALDDPDQVLATVYQVLDNFLAPRIRFHTLAELLAQGQPIDEIMDGPRLEHGFIVTAELEALAGPRTGLRASDLIQEIMNVAGVRAVNTIELSDGVTSDAWYLPLDPTRTPILDLAQSLRAEQPAIQLVRHGLAVRTDGERVAQLLQARQRDDRATPPPAAQLDLTLPAGRNRQVARYYPIQQQLPALYALGAAGLPASASAEWQAQVKQLQAYLLFFDQLLANAFAQVAHVKDLFAFDGAARPSYFAQPLDDPALGLADIWVQSDAATRAAHLQTLTEAPATALARKNRFLNHLLARFGETFTEFDFAQRAPDAALASKAAFLQAYPAMSGGRGQAFDITQPATHHGFARSSLAQRLSHKLGLAGVQPPTLATLAPDDPGGFYLVEHILLRPEVTDPVATALAPGEVGWQAGALLALPQSTARPDPYSQQLTLVFPDWITRFNRANFQDFMKQTLREETPAHLALQLLWLSQQQMAVFDTVYHEWRTTLLPTTTDPERIAARAARDRLLDWLGLGAPYPLRDLPLDYVAMVAVDQPAAIQIRQAQPGVTYQLCDEEGNPLDDTKPLMLDWKTPPTTATLTTPKITADRTFTILATRTHTARGEALSSPLETYVKQSVSLKAGINTGLDVTFFVGEQRLDADNPAPIDYNATITAKVKLSQAGISYQLVEEEGQSQSARSPVVAGDQSATITLTSTSLAEDTTIKIRAYRPSGSNSAAVTDALLKRTIALKVRPNPAVAVRITPPIVDYQEQAKLTLVGAQPSVTYQIYQRLLNANEYATNDQAPDTLRVAGEAGRIISIKAPPPISDWNQPVPFAPGQLFAVDANGAPTATLTDLREDSYVIVRATKTANQASLALDQVVVILVRPDRAPAVDVVQTPIPMGSAGVVTVNGTQRGVAYQLLAADQPTNAPGYDYYDRALETMRIEVDFAVDFAVKAPDDATADRTLYLPTGPLAEKTEFSVQATKVRTGLGAPLTGRVMIAIDPPPSTPPAATAPTTRAVAPLAADLLVSAETASLPAASVVAAPAVPEVGLEIIPEAAVVDYGQATRIRIKASRAQEWYQLWLADQPLADPVKGTGRDRLLATPPLQTDTRLTLHITRPNDPTAAERVIELLVQVRPDPTLTVSAAAETVAANEATRITVAASQVGVQYQLWAGDQPVGAPVDGDGALIALPTGPLTATTTFTIRATRLDQPTLFVDLAQPVTVRVGS